MGTIELIETIEDDHGKYIKSPKLDGEFRNMLFQNMLSSQSESTVFDIFSNAYKALPYFADPSDNQNVTKVLCLGKVQSGKTAFFISVIALAFDNGYDVAYLMGGTKNSLRDQNYERVLNEFSNNSNVKVLELNNTSPEDIAAYVDNGYKVIAVVLKNAPERKNIGKMQESMQHNFGLTTLIVDDEGDEYSPGAPKLKEKNPRAGRTHDAIADLLSSANCITYLSVTATPQANLLISTIDELSPEHIVLVEPGKGYTGGNSFHDTSDNPHVIQIKDTDDFEDSIPVSFMNALYFFIFACSLKLAEGNESPFSMLVHPSSLTKVHAMVSEKIDEAYSLIFDNLYDENNITYEDQCQEIRQQYNNYIADNPSCEVSFEQVIKCVKTVLSQMQVIQFNASSQDEIDDKKKYRIFVGGNMLGRGLTIKNLCVTYIYRESKETAIDTLYQRARWFGYKKSYFDICKVYMTGSLKQAFMDTVDNENDMWNALRAYLLTNVELKKFPRVFKLDNDKLILTRKSVAKTVTLQRVNPGYSYNKSVMWNAENKQKNRELYEDFYEKWKDKGAELSFATNSSQEHFVIHMKYSTFLEEFLRKYSYPKETSFGVKGFERIKQSIDDGFMEDSVDVVIMRYKSKQFRSLSASKYTIKELPQSWNAGTNYSGDKMLTGFYDRFHFQIHLVYVEEDNKSDYMPMLAMNNPITEFTARYVTGDNYYETV